MSDSFSEWAILELMGHRRLAGMVTEATLAGGAFVRIDVFTDADRAIATQYYSPAAVYCITPTTEQMAREVAKREQPRPVERWELPPPEASPGVRRCRVCGCTDDDCRQCIEKTGEPCHWVEEDLCSACAEDPDREEGEAERQEAMEGYCHQVPVGQGDGDQE